DGADRHIMGVDESLADGRGHGGADQGAQEFEHGGNGDALVGGENLGGDNGGDGIGGIMKTVDEFKHQGHDDDHEDEQNRCGHAPGLRVFKDDVKNDIAGVAATVEDLFQYLVKVFKHNYFDRGMIAVIQLPQRFQHQLVRFAFNVLEFIVLHFDFFEIDPFAQFFDEQHHGIGGFAQHVHLF